METATKDAAQVRRVTPDVIKYVEDRQRPREGFGEALRRLFFSEREAAGSGNGAHQAPETSRSA